MLIALSESGAKREVMSDLIRQSLRDLDAKAHLEKCLRSGDLTDPARINADDALAILGEALREANLDDQQAMYEDIMKQLHDKPDLRSSFLAAVSKDDGVEDSLRERALKELNAVSG